MKVLIQVVLATVAAVAVVAGASAAAPQPSVAGMTIGAADVPGAKVQSQGNVKETGYLAAYQRTLKLSVPYGRSRIVLVKSEGAISLTAQNVTTDLVEIQRELASSAGRAAIVKIIAGELGIKKTDVKLSALRHPAVGDGTVELPLSITFKGIHLYQSILYMHMDRVLAYFLVEGSRPIAQADSAALARISLAHIVKAMTPLELTPPAITGTVDLGQTLTVTPGTYSNSDVALTYQWQHCDATGANCVPIDGATGPTYIVSAADQGTTLDVVETATDRFGTPTATSVPTAEIPVPVPTPTPQ